MAFSLSSLEALVTKFLSWWLGELKAIYRPIDRLVKRSRPTLTLSPFDDRWILHLHKGGRVKELNRVDLGSRPDMSKKAIRPVVKNGSLRNADLTILLSREGTLRRTLDMPSLAEPDLRRALSFEIDRQTPFRADDVYFDYRILDRYPETKRVTVELTTVPRATVDAVLANVHDWGLQPSSVDIMGDNGDNLGGKGLNLLSGPEGAQVGRRSYLRAASPVLLFLLLLVVLFIPVWQLATLDKSLAEQVAKEKEAANETLAMRDNLLRTFESAQFLDIRKKETPVALEVLNELTKALPDDTWLLSVQQRNTEVKISGYSAAAAKLISALDGVPLFKEPAFTSSIVPDQRQNRERFEILFKVDVTGSRTP